MLEIIGGITITAFITVVVVAFIAIITVDDYEGLLWGCIFVIIFYVLTVGTFVGDPSSFGYQEIEEVEE